MNNFQLMYLLIAGVGVYYSPEFYSGSGIDGPTSMEEMKREYFAARIEEEKAKKEAAEDEANYTGEPAYGSEFGEPVQPK